MRGTELPDLGLPETPAPVFVDLDGDRVPELIAIGDAGLYVRPGLGGGAFGAPRVLSTAAGLAALAVGDLDGDGRLDVVGSGYGPLLFLLQLADGGFDGHLVPDAGTWTGITADLDGNGRASFIASDEANHLGVWALWEDGGVGPRSIVDGGHFDDFWEMRLFLTDIDGDGSPEIVLLNRSGMWFTRWHCDHLEPVTKAGVYGAPKAIADLDGDGRADLIADSEVMLGLGDGGFSVSGRIGGLSTVFAAAATDLDGDGTPELVSTTRLSSGYECEIAKRGPAGTFDVVQRYDCGLGNSTTFDLGAQVADVDGDGAPDLVMGSRVIRNDGTGRLQAAELLGDAGFRVTPDLALADVDGDGVNDILAWCTDGGASWFEALPTGAFAPPQPLVSAAGVKDVRQFLDLDGDGRADMIHTTPSGLFFAHGAGDGSFVDVGVVGPVAVRAFAPATDGTGRDALDVLTLDGVLQLFAGDGGVASRTLLWLDGGFGPSFDRLAHADFDGDGVEDLLTCGSPCSLWWGLADGGYSEATQTALFNHEHLVAGDYDGDGKADLITDGLRILLSQGDGGFVLASTAPMGAMEPALVDLASDGRLEIGAIVGANLALLPAGTLDGGAVARTPVSGRAQGHLVAGRLGAGGGWGFVTSNDTNQVVVVGDLCWPDAGP
ncbi:MAG: VCBS repeat-containing protein [Deltaproteobacteria bacterium]|nr:VCBS repeat-containing protein [Deltaproteobacteria bacterium]